jgi:hypothetical protein
MDEHGPAASRHHLVMWQRVPPSAGHSLGRLARDDQDWLAHGAEVLLDGGDPVACRFEVRLDTAWRTRAVSVAAVSSDVKRLEAHADVGRRWWVDGIERLDLRGCVDVDVAATPLTNTFPIRRLRDLAPGEAVTSPVAWVDVPALDVRRVDQTYRRLGPTGHDGLDAWEYRDPLHGAFRLTVDRDGLVVDYEGFARRVHP